MEKQRSNKEAENKDKAKHQTKKLVGRETDIGAAERVTLDHMEEGRLPFICRKSFSATRPPTAPNICSSEAGSLIDRFVLVSALHELTEDGSKAQSIRGLHSLQMMNPLVDAALTFPVTSAYSAEDVEEERTITRSYWDWVNGCEPLLSKSPLLSIISRLQKNNNQWIDRTVDGGGMRERERDREMDA
ncbi:uncharacterized protein BO96DRAFT_470960 [Aspergillus niger CBS 101883]|uniref:Uncharacterized protein n=2 Tax=Aspergillus niger TaxID=5061 RepID=A2QSL3_ASPNC|nr:uncharacterized protein BO96DRAFT_470960 [Aspergillus niger CBS 101883]XP_059604198.1 hypothetical protein An08g11140 [Aspergillus niger]PYH50147.1 hypothetical protein BO96DRAFT_470960 [Aspergillus niger CBS 101883]CAK45785.1 hypothetical protein An08g11140 [Aspergillus niger]